MLKIMLSALVDKLPAASPDIKFEMNAKPIDLSSWSQLLPMLKEYELEGKMNLSPSANGPLAQLQYKSI